MTYTSDDLIKLLDLEPLEHNIYRGQNRDIGTNRIFGGQVLAQALVAAQRTVEADRPVHSLHGYFILAGDLSVPVVYFVDRLRDGGSFTTRRVTAIQHGRAISNVSASFHRPEEGFSHQIDMPDVPPPDAVRSELDALRERAAVVPEGERTVLTQDRPLDFRPVGEDDPFDASVRLARRMMWVRATRPMNDNPLHHQAVLTYASDYGLIVTALRPHGRALRDPDLMVASLDHSIWFHRPFRMDEWLLYVIDAPVAAGGRGFARGTYYTQAGELVASVAQEGLLRIRTDRRT